MKECFWFVLSFCLSVFFSVGLLVWTGSGGIAAAILAESTPFANMTVFPLLCAVSGCVASMFYWTVRLALRHDREGLEEVEA